MEKLMLQTLLYDFYGELLTEHQKKIYENVVFDDLSLSEVAEEHGISRQGVHDLIKRCTKILNDYEEKLHLIDKFMKTRSMVEEIHTLTKRYMATGDMECLHKVEQISSEISRL